jgi:hypothetical protein
MALHLPLPLQPPDRKQLNIAKAYPNLYIVLILVLVMISGLVAGMFSP